MIASAREFVELTPETTAKRLPKARRSTKLRWPGWVFITTSLFLAIGAFNGQNNLLFFTFGLSVLAILLSGIISGSSMLGIRVTRVLPRSVSVSGSAVLQYHVENRNRVLPIFGVLIEEIWDRDEALQTGSAKIRPGLVLGLRAREIGRVRTVIHGTKSGQVYLRGYRIRSSMPFGLLEKRIDFECPGRVEVHPAVLPMRRVRAEQAGSTRFSRSDLASSHTGQDEFLGVREYVPGDPIRHIAWARSATHDSLVVKTHTAPRTETCWVHAELGSVSEKDREFVLTATASLIADRIRLGMAVGLEVPEWGVMIKPRAGRGQLLRVLSVLAHRAGPIEGDARKPRQGERWWIRVGLAEANGPGTVIDATNTESWLVPEAELPETLHGEAEQGSSLALLGKRVRVFTGASNR